MRAPSRQKVAHHSVLNHDDDGGNMVIVQLQCYGQAVRVVAVVVVTMEGRRSKSRERERNDTKGNELALA